MNSHFDPHEFQLSINRRTFLSHSAYGLGSIALAWLLDSKLAASAPAATSEGPWRGVVNPPHFPVRAKRIIHLCMAGGPSHLESFDYKPELKRIHGQPFPESLTKGQQLAQLQNTELKARGPFTEFNRHGHQQARPVRPGNLRPLPPHRWHRRRHLYRPLDAYRTN